MSLALEHYLDQVMAYANRMDHDAARIRAELADHLEEKLERLVKTGIPREDAVFQVIQEQGHPRVVGYGLRPAFPLVDVRWHGTARGVVAVGPKAVGVVAFGGAACGVLAFGGLSAGLVSMGGISVALLFAWAGVGLATFSFSGIALGFLAAGAVAVGVIAHGAASIGIWAPGWPHWSYYDAQSVPEWMAALDSYSPGFAELLAFLVLLLVMCAASLVVPGLLNRRERLRLNQRGICVLE